MSTAVKRSARVRNITRIARKLKKKGFKKSNDKAVTGMRRFNRSVSVEKFLISFSFSREWNSYFKDPYNYFDWLGLVLTFLVIPLRFAEVKSQWSVAGLGYLFNFLRLFKFSCVSRYCGLLVIMHSTLYVNL